jgi:hypothetical protein
MPACGFGPFTVVRALQRLLGQLVVFRTPWHARRRGGHGFPFDTACAIFQKAALRPNEHLEVDRAKRRIGNALCHASSSAPPTVHHH